MSETVNIDLEDPQWFTDEVHKLTVKFMVEVSAVLNELDDEIETMAQAGFGESLLEKLIRDVKAASIDKINAKIEKLLN